MLIKSLLFLLFLLLFLVTSFAFPVRAATGETNTDTHRFKQLHEYALLANAAYLGNADVEKVLAKSGFELTTSDELPGYGVSYYLATNDAQKRHIIAVRGTSNIENALVDVAFVLLPDARAGIKIHQGFSVSADYIFDKIKPELNKDYRINTTGHSLGGAAALVLAMYLDASGYEVGEVITFGQPKVTNIQGSRAYAHLNVTRVVTPKDMVPLVPPMDPMDMMNMDIYWHQGTEIVLQQGNVYSELEGLDSMMRATDFMNEMVTDKNLKHHFMTTYINMLASKMVKVKQVPYENDFSIYDWFGGKRTGTPAYSE